MSSPHSSWDTMNVDPILLSTSNHGSNNRLLLLSLESLDHLPSKCIRLIVDERTKIVAKGRTKGITKEMEGTAVAMVTAAMVVTSTVSMGMVKAVTTLGALAMAVGKG
ncbi:hypothetical protein CRG98_015019 [Punica granatum]|uniref:Uncharacterized protein n=1 Tax=Punica granatum TaxID=22663 RepID=A0A2I0K7R4_PUNGR|nr:hypothetical protein CRG98_015019 [Punica granatum]